MDYDCVTMKNFLAPVLLLAAATLVGCNPEEDSYASGTPSKPPEKGAPAEKPAKEAESIQDIDVAGAAKLLGADDSVVILDIRTPGEFAKGHIQGAINIDYRSGDFAAKIGALDKSKKYIMHCQSGGRSGESLPKFKELGFECVYHLDAGFAGWQENGHPFDISDGK